MKKGNRIPETESRLGYLRTDPDRYMTQEQVAAAIGCTPKTYRRWAKDRNLPNTTDLIALAELFGVSCDYLLYRTKYKNIESGMVSTITGLSEDAVSTITALQCGDILSALIVQPEFAEVVEKIRRLQDNSQMDYLERHDIASAIFANIKTGKGHIPFDDRRDSLRYRIGTLFATMVDRLTGK